MFQFSCVQRDLRAYNLALNKAVDLAEKPSSVEADVYVRSYTLLVIKKRTLYSGLMSVSRAQSCLCGRCAG